MSHHRAFVAVLGMLLVNSVRAQAPAEPFLPNSPHRVLTVSGQPDSLYLIEEDKPLSAEVEGPGLIELTLRRVIFTGDPPVQPTSVRVFLDRVMQPPITFRRAREEKLIFVDEPRFSPSAPRDAKIAVPAGAHVLELSVGGGTVAVAVSMRLRVASALAPDSLGSKEALPPLEDIPVTDSAVDPPPSVPTPAPEVEPAAAPVPAPDLEPPATPEPPAYDPLPGSSPGLSAPPSTADARVTPHPTRRVATADLGLGLSTTFINLGGPSLALHLGGRYIPPWLDGQLRLGADLAMTRYALRSSGSEPPVLDAANWVFPLLAVAAFAPKLPLDWLELELGAGLGLALSAATTRYQGRDRSAAGFGGAAALFAEVAIPLGPAAACARLQLDAISASNDLMVRFNYLGGSALIGARMWF